MAVLAIRKLGDPVLRTRASGVREVNDNIRKMLKDMADTMYDAPGVGLAGPQVGILKRIVVIDIGDKLYQLVNPEIIESDGKDVAEEGCLSIPGEVGEVPRSARVVVEALDERGEPVRIEAEGLLARALQHEIDHLNGILFVDRALVTRKKEEV